MIFGNNENTANNNTERFFIMAEYFNPGESRSLFNFTTSLQNLLEKKNYHSRDIVLVCIGSDRATGDCLGPIVGHKLARFCSTHKNSLHLFGTLEQPIHAKNLEATLQFIHSCYKNALIIAIDASLGVVEHVGYITLGEGALCPGVGVDKNLPEVGDIFTCEQNPCLPASLTVNSHVNEGCPAVHFDHLTPKGVRVLYNLPYYFHCFCVNIQHV